MGNSTLGPDPPLKRLDEAEIDHLLRGFPDLAREGAQGLRLETNPRHFDTCLLGILAFYLPAGTPAPTELPSPEARLKEDLGLDSLALAEAMFKIEELFEIRIENAELAEITTLGGARDLLVSKLDRLPSSPAEG